MKHWYFILKYLISTKAVLALPTLAIVSLDAILGGSNGRCMESRGPFLVAC
ncbi:MAG: hypothetical protein ACW99A_16095 [Candidatus Kariarchaeaceae archaeon]